MTEADAILKKIPGTAREWLDALDWFAELESTSTWLKLQASPPRGRFRAVIAEYQTAGRGRDGKIWLSPPGSGVCLSVAYTFSAVPTSLPGLTLAIGTGIAAALRQAGARDMALKWPNDLLALDGKLGGILTEVQPDDVGGQTAVVGVGINVDLPDSMRYAPPTSWTSRISDLAACMDEVPERTQLAAALIATLIDSIRRFEAEGLAGFRSEWRALDWLRGKTVSVQQAGGHLIGVADGIDEDGALLVKTNAGTERVMSGSVKVPTNGEAST
jgi:BirA family biotin operon repressor/biotin-[acetyl-CoA-carboxylase] ligase